MHVSPSGRFVRSMAVAIASLFLSANGRTQAAEDGQALLDKLTKTYADLPAYADQGQVFVVDTEGKSGDRQNARTQFGRPEKLRVETDDIRLVIDAGQSTTVLDSLRNSQAEKLSAMPDADTLLVGPLGAALLGSPLGHPQTILLHLLLDKKPAEWFIREGKPVAEAETTVGDRKAHRLTIDRPLRPDWRLTIDAESGLLTRVEVLPTDPSKKSIVVRWEAGEIVTKPAGDAAWSLDVPKDYASIDKKVAGFRKEAAEKKKKPDSELVGKPVPDFPMEIIGADGKTKQARLSDFKGKPLVIDVWATWCAPCRKSLPELTSTLLTLDDKSTLQTILLSIDQKADDGKELPDHVRKGLERMGVNLATLPRTILALDRESTGAKALNAAAIPMTVLVDSQGIVRKVHVGITPATTLRKDIAELK